MRTDEDDAVVVPRDSRYITPQALRPAGAEGGILRGNLCTNCGTSEPADAARSVRKVHRPCEPERGIVPPGVELAETCPGKKNSGQLSSGFKT